MNQDKKTEDTPEVKIILGMVRLRDENAFDPAEFKADFNNDYFTIDQLLHRCK